MTRHRVTPSAPALAPAASLVDYNDYIVTGRRLQAQAVQRAFGQLARRAVRLLRRAPHA